MEPKSTFHDACSDGVAWQKKIRDSYLGDGTPPVPHLSVKRAVVKEVTRNFATQVILKYEWLGTMANTTFHTGIFFGAYCAGVCCVGLNGSGQPSPVMHKRYGVERREIAVLARGACVHWAPKGSNSKLVSWTARLLGRIGVKVVLAFSDSDAGEVGTIYQACNWTYIGKGGKGKRGAVSPLGRILSDRSIMQAAIRAGITPTELRSRMESEGWTMCVQNRKGTYVWVIDRKDKELCKRVESLAQPYPKRNCAPEAQGAVRPPLQAGGDGSTPISALQLEQVD